MSRGRHRLVGRHAMARAMRVSPDTMRLYRRAFDGLGLVVHTPGTWDLDPRLRVAGLLDLVTTDPESFIRAVPDGLEVWVTSRDTGVSPSDEALPEPPPRYVWMATWRTPAHLPRWLIRMSHAVPPIPPRASQC